MVKKKIARPRVLKPAKSQRGKSNTSADRKRKALGPGQRRSKTGKTYSERRKNRSDMPGKRT